MGFGGSGWWHGQSHGELTALSGVCGLVAGEVLFSKGANMGSITVVKWKATPRVGKFGEIMPSAVQFPWLRNSLLASRLHVYAWYLGSDHPHVRRAADYIIVAKQLGVDVTALNPRTT